jgi:hypothetical protein
MMIMQRAPKSVHTVQMHLSGTLTLDSPAPKKTGMLPFRLISGFSRSARKGSAADGRRCFSIISADGRRALHLELPGRGNGRSRREWMDAISGIIARNPLFDLRVPQQP